MKKKNKMEYNTSNSQLWFNQVGEEDEEVIQTDSDSNQSPQPDQAVSGETPTMGDSESLGGGVMTDMDESSADVLPTANLMQKASSSGSIDYDRFLPTIADGGRDFSRYPDGGLPAINNPDSSEFDPNAEGSRDSLGRVRWGSKDWEKYNANKSSGENLSRGVKGLGSGGGFGSGSSTTVVTPPFNAVATGSGMKNMLPIIGGALVLGTIGYFSFIKK